MARRMYPELCVLKRSFDDQTQPRICLETQVLGLTVQAVQDGRLELVTSSLLDYENSQNPMLLRRYERRKRKK